MAGTGSGGFSGDGGPATSASLNEPIGVTVDGSGNVFIADTQNGRIRRVAAATGVITTVATNLNWPQGVAVDRAGNVFISDSNNSRIRRLAAGTGVTTIVAGNGVIFNPNVEHEHEIEPGDDGPATSARLHNPRGVAVDNSGNVFIAEMSSHRIRRVDARTRVITTVVSGSVYGSVTDPMGVAVDTSGNMFIVDHRNSRIQRVDARTRDITTVAGNGNWWDPNRGFSGDGGPGTSASLHYPYGVAVDGSGNVFIADTYNHRIRRVDARTGVITTVVGNGAGGFSGDGGAATSASLHYPSAVAVDNNGNLFISDMRNNRIRRVNGPFL